MIEKGREKIPQTNPVKLAIVNVFTLSGTEITTLKTKAVRREMALLE